MERVFLEYRGDQIALSPGAHVIGRGLSCTVRLNDITVSREHLRIEVRGSQVTATDLGSRNGSLVNGSRLEGPRVIQSGDQIVIGNQQLRIVLVNLLSDAEATDLEEEDTADRDPLAVVPSERTSKPTLDKLAAVDSDSRLALPRIEYLHCPRCRHRVPAEQQSCPACGHRFQRSGPLFTTQVIKIADRKSAPAGNERRSDRRVAVDLLLLYVSDNLSLNAVARDLSLGGVFVATDLLDEVGTTCDITFLPEGRPAVQCRGVVRHVTKAPGPDGRPAGMGVQFTHLGLGGKEWLSTLIPAA